MRINVRPYGHGKFRTTADEQIYSLSLDGCDDETGSVVDEGIWLGIMTFENDPIVLVYPDHTEEYTAVLITEDDRGFVEVEYFKNPAEAQSRFDTAVNVG